MNHKKANFIASITLILFTLLCAPVYANENAPVSEWFNQDEKPNNPIDPSPQLNADSPSFTMLLVRTVIVLLIIIAMIYGLSRWISKRNNSIVSNQFITVKSGIHLGQNKSLRLVKVGSTYYLIGIGNDVQLLKEFTTEAEIAEIEESFQQSNETLVSSSKKVWNDIRSLFHKEELAKENQFHSHLEERLNNLRESSRGQLGANDRDEKQRNRGELNQ